MSVRALIPTRVIFKRPSKSGTYLTEMGELYFDKSSQNFYSDSSLTIPLGIIVREWYEPVELYTVEQLDDEYERGYSNGLNVNAQVCSIT